MRGGTALAALASACSAGCSLYGSKDDSTSDAGSALAATTVIASGQLVPTGIALGPDEVYWTNYVQDGSVMRCAKTGCGGAAVPLAEHQIGPNAIVFTPDRVFWSA